EYGGKQRRKQDACYRGSSRGSQLRAGQSRLVTRHGGAPGGPQSSILVPVGKTQSLPVFDSRSCPILSVKIGTFDAPIEVLEVGVHKSGPIAADTVGELRHSGSQAPHYLDRIPAILADFVERDPQVVVPARHLE